MCLQCVKKHNYISDMYVFFFFLNLTSGPPNWNWKMKFYVLSNQVDLIFLKIFTKVSLSIVVWNLKTSKRSFLNSVFKYLKMSNVTQILIKKIITKCIVFFFFFLNHIFQNLNTENCCLESHTKPALNDANYFECKNCSTIN